MDKCNMKSIASPGRGILAIDESNATCGKRLASIGLDNNEKFVDCLRDENIVPGIKVDKGLVPLPGSNNESWCQGLDGLASRSAEYYKQGARFAKWRTVVSVPCGPSALAVKEAAWGLARYAAISQDNGLVPIVEPEILLDGDHGIDRTLEVAEKVWAEVFFYLAENNVMFEVSIGRTIEVEATLNLNAMNQSPNPWHVSFSYARALQNTVLKTWQGRPENVEAAQKALLVRAKANSLAQLGKYAAEGESEEAKKGMFVKGYTY
ncbi:hypothetical protein GH714_018232 [Hevea brasiliensis]|uniref:fructose-bisphosphate aldolase n=1 Tax=Hevea brasiliensis TaxID=3981 RepID=A0A6A6MEH5_HEVBR|nr:hypothetical protein GH714_018232 [Hevea brasiliensis]